MDIKKIVGKVDHTLLKQTATFNEIKALCDDAIMYNTASVCIPPSYVKAAKNYVKDSLKICTVIGFPNGYNTTESKVFEAQNAIKNGADEIDMVINLCDVKNAQFDIILDEIKQIKAACGHKTLKVIVETCLLTEEEKVKLCKIVSQSGADYIKTSTGFSTGGATFDDIKLFSKHVSEKVKIKAAGGINSIEDAEKFIELGASRLGTSKVIKILKEASLNM